MASTIPTPSRPATNPPTTALPPIPTAKQQKSPRIPSDGERVPSPSHFNSKLRTPSAPSATTPKSTSQSSTPSLAPALKLESKKELNGNTSALRKAPSASRALNGSTEDKSVRRSVSIASFPQPPKASGRSSLAAGSPSTSNGPSPKSRSPERKPTKGPSLKKKTSSGPSSLRNSKPSLLDGSAAGQSITGGDKDSESGYGMPSPPLSRSSSPQGSTVTDSKRGSKIKEGKGNVLVSVRVRPDTSNAENANSEGEWLVDGRRTLVSYRGKEGGDYYYDNVFTTHDNNAKVYDAGAKRLVRRVMEGYHGTVFAYGMTGTGKTFSMQGTATSPGVIPLAITDIFSYIRETPHREFLLRVSYLEIYNEKIHDLLSTPVGGGPGAAQQEEIKLREDSKRGVYATPLKEEIVQSPTQLLRVIARGDHARRTSSTQFNARSSRSHAVVQIVVESRERVSAAPSQEKRSALTPGGVRVSTLSLIDLAGSEKAAENKERRTEGAHINKSLLTLGTVISRLAGEKEKPGSAADAKHLPYRDSKLTRLLQPALSGNSIVSILCTIQIGSGGSAAPANSHTGETLNTLKFAARAKNNIVSHAKRAEETLGSAGDGGSRVLLERYRMEIQTLRSQLEEQAKKDSEQEVDTEEKQEETTEDPVSRHEEQMLEMQLARTALKERIEHLNRLILSSKSTGVNASGTMSLIGGMSALAGSIGGGDTKSLRSSASQSTLGTFQNGQNLSRTASLASVRSIGSVRSHATASGPAPIQPYGNGDDEDMMGEFGDGMASLQMQVNSLQADLADKNRYISTLERRLLQARRSSHSRMSMGISHLKGGSTGSTGNAGTATNGGTSAVTDDTDVNAILREKDMEIADLRIQLDDKDRMVTAFRSAARQRDVAQLAGSPTTSSSTPTLGPDPDGANGKSNHQSTESNSSSLASGSNANTNATSASESTPAAGAGSESGPALQSPVKLSSEEKVSGNKESKDTKEAKETNETNETNKDNEKGKDGEQPEKKRRSVDEMSRMLDEMIQDRVENGQIVKGPRGSMRVRSATVKKDGEGDATVPEEGNEQSKQLDTVDEHAVEASSGP